MVWGAPGVCKLHRIYRQQETLCVPCAFMETEYE